MVAWVEQHAAAGTWEDLGRQLTNRFSIEKSADLTDLVRREHEAAQEAAAAARLAAGTASPEVAPPTPIERVRERLLERLAADTHEEIVKKLTRRYQSSLRNLKQIESDEVLQFWLSALGHAYDPHTDYFGKRELDQFSISMNLALFGIGATLTSEDGYTVIRSLVAGAPAEMSKQIKVNDRIVGVAQGEDEFVDVLGEKLNKVVEQIRGPRAPGSGCWSSRRAPTPRSARSSRWCATR